jgi:hypothetical protein
MSVGSRNSYIAIVSLSAALLFAGCSLKKTITYKRRAGASDSTASSSLSAVNVKVTFNEKFFADQSIDPKSLTSFKLTLGEQKRDGTYSGGAIELSDMSPESGVALQVELLDGDGIAVVGKKEDCNIVEGDNELHVEDMENVKGINSDWDGKDFKGDSIWQVSESEK